MQRQVVRRHRRRAVADALADQQRADQAGDARVDVHDRAAGEVERALLEQEARARRRGRRRRPRRCTRPGRPRTRPCARSADTRT